jgi:BirA family transcriptional regulator, biotin operon repressor / biotin---[acetyl-CoA-carboxylase] ligase
LADSSFERFRRMMDSMEFETLPLFSKPHFSWNLSTDYVGRRFVYRPESESTMDDARRMLERFRLTDGALLLAERQTAGRGRVGRSWVSPPDVNLYFTIILTPGPADVRCLAYVAPLAVAKAVEEIAGTKGVELRPDLKWPNDVLIDGKKVAGVLIETTSTTEGRLVALIGIGINVNLHTTDYAEIRDVAISLKDALGFAIAREEVLAAACNHFEALYESARGGNLAPFQEWRERLVNLGRPVVANGTHEQVEGIAVDVADDGALIIERLNGERVSVEAGDVTLRPAS